MTLEEALTRIQELAEENEELKKMARPRNHYREAFPGLYAFKKSFMPRLYDDDLSKICSVLRRVTFGTVPCKRRWSSGEDAKVHDTQRAKTVIELTDEEYAHYTKYFHALLKLIADSVEEWANKEGE